MSNHFLSIKRGNDGFRNNDFTTGAASTAGDDVELRIADVDGQGVALTRKDVVIALKAFTRVMESGNQIMNFPIK